MFSIPLPATLHQMFSAPFVARSRGAAADGGAPVRVAPRAPVPTPLMSAYDDPLPDLDQRVRSVGEW